MEVEAMRIHEGVAVKEEPLNNLDEDEIFGSADINTGYGGGGGGDEELVSVPRPMEGLCEVDLPPFVKKTFEMVDDPNTDSVISWSPNKTSFVVWDPHKLSTDVLPTRFKHKNFSSFIRQLNTYRFRKIDSDRWEFANEGFQKGKKDLLKTVKRRKQHPQTKQQQQGVAENRLFSWKNGAEAELQKLRNEQDMLKMEITKLKQQQDTTEKNLTMVKERLESSKNRQKYVIFLMVRVLKDPISVQHLIENMKQITSIYNGQGAKKRKLTGTENIEGSVEAMNTMNGIIDIASGSVDAKKLKGQEELLTVQSEILTFSSSDESSSPVEDQKVKKPLADNSLEMNSENFILWEKLMEDDMIYENEVEAAKHQSVIVHELEDLIAEPPEMDMWGRTLVEQTVNSYSNISVSSPFIRRQMCDPQ